MGDLFFHSLPIKQLRVDPTGHLLQSWGLGGNCQPQHSLQASDILQTLYEETVKTPTPWAGFHQGSIYCPKHEHKWFNL